MSSFHAPPRFARKVVRDLWFCISTPHLLGEPISADADVEFPRLIPDEWTTRVAWHPATVKWLKELDADATHLTTWIASNALQFRRMGYYFS